MAQRGAVALDQVRLFVVDEIDDMISPAKRDQLYDVRTHTTSTHIVR
jgi:superfamily II DNA/RNA helicase